MKRASTDDPVAHFSNIAREFHALYDQSEAFRQRLRVWRGILDRRATRGGLALDMGCGSGIFSFDLAERGYRVIGVDAAPDMVALCEEGRRARGLADMRFIQARLPAIDEAELAGADLIISSSLVEFVEDLDGTLALFARLLCPGGTLVVSMPNAFSLSRNYERAEYRLTGKPEIYRFIKHFSDPTWLARRLGPRGFTLEETEYYAHDTRIARLARKLFLPAKLTEDLFVAAFRKAGPRAGSSA
jgi:2-polyprenyl-3-methyl-5-hydroxy-6-metoxy-1,4-benzoquinol methylase